MIDFVINEKAGGGRTLKAKNKICKILDEKGVEYRFHPTKGVKDATKITKDLCDNGATLVVAVGGDGTVNEVLNGLNVETTAFGIIPSGSGNDFVTSIGIPTKVEKALDIILSGEAKPTDFMVCDGIRGINIIGTGIDVEILQRCEKSKILKGKLKYVISFIISLFKFKFYDLKLPDKEGNLKDRSAMIICCGNGKRFGGGITMCPKAIVDDGKMDFIFINRMRKVGILKAFIRLFQERILEEKFCDFSLEEHVVAHFNHPISIQIDGEIYDNLKFDIHIEKGALKLYRP